jgi:hypothetical protein
MYSIAGRLVNLTETHGITSIFTYLTEQEAGATVTSHGIFSIFHNIILLRYVEAEGQLKRSMLILKMRASSHDQSILQITIQNKIGIKIIGDMKDYEGILTGVAKKVYQKYLEDEKKIDEKETRDRQRRRSDMDVHQKKTAQQRKRAKLGRKRNRI